MDRRSFLGTSLAAGMAAVLQPVLGQAAPPAGLKVAPFRFDVTPPLGHPLCGGWIKPAVAIDDPLEAIGFVLTGAGAPIVVCAVDWTGLLNEAHVRWRTALAEAAGTTPDRVAVQCVHQHNAPFVCLEADEIAAAQNGLPRVVQVEFFDECLARARKAVAEALPRARPVTHVATGKAQVEKVAGNRRFIGPEGKIVDWRASSSKNPKHRDLPEGLIDPWLRTVAFFDGMTKVLACHYYATHPMSFYGDGRVNSDFVGLARKRRQAEEPGCTHLYFTGASGNVAAGKYNNGTPEARQQLTDRIYAGIVASEADLRPQPIASLDWRTAPVELPPRDELAEETLLQRIANPEAAVSARIIDAMRLSWLRRCGRKTPVVLSALHVNDVTLLHLPGESFVEYQLAAQAAAPDRFVATAAYGDGGMWYIPTADAYPQGGYEIDVAFTDPAVAKILNAGAKSVVTPPA